MNKMELSVLILLFTEDTTTAHPRIIWETLYNH